VDRRPSLGFWSIPRKLLVLLLIAFLPASAIIVSSSLVQRDRAIQEAGKGAILLARSLAAQQEQITAGTKQMLNTLAQLSEVKNLDAAACSKLFSQLHENYPAYSLIAAMRPDGSVFASDPPFEPGTSLSDRKYVRDAIRTHDFSAGEYILGRISKLPSFSFAYPVLGQDGKLILILSASLRLDEYAHFLRNANLPEGSAVSIMDHKGIRLFRFPEKNGIGPGQPVPEASFRKMSGDLDPGTFERTGEDGVPRIYAFKQLRLREDYTPYLYVSVGYANRKIFQTANREMLGYLFILGTVVLLVMCAAWLFAHHLLILPIKKLVETTRLFGKGDLGTRTGLPHSPNEVGQLAKSFDDMASLLEIRDTESQRANEALRASEEMFRLLVENAPDAIFVQTQGLFAYVNPAAVRLFGAASPDQLVGKPSLDRVHPSFHETVRKRIHLLGAEKKPLANAEVKLIRIDGSIVDAESSAVPITYNGHDGALVFVRDISERKWAEKEREHLNRLNQLILDAVNEGIIGLDAEGRGIFANPSAMAMLGYELEEMLGKDMHDLIHHSKEEGSVYPRHECLTLITLKTGTPHPMIENLFWRKNGESFPVVSSCTPIIEAGAVIGVVITFLDITERKRDEEIKSTLEAKLRLAQKLEALGTLAGGIAHDFNNILAPIIGFTEIALNDVRHSSPLKNNLEQVLKAALRARDLVKQVLTFSRPGRENERAPLEISMIVKEVMKLLRASLPATIEIRQYLEKGCALADATQIHQVLMNLFVNAAHAMNDTGVLEVNLIRIDLRESDLASLSLIGIRPGAYLKLSVSDSGGGIDEEIMKQIFEPYFTTKEAGKGTGLGLAVVHGIVRRHEGAVSVQSIVGKGTTFNIYIPEIKLKAEDPSEPLDEVAKGNENILLVDDEQIMVEMGTMILERLGYKVTSETDSPRALELFRANAGRFDLVITDFTMPKLTGTVLAKEISRIRPGIPIIICTGFSETVTPSITEEFDLAFIMKPFVVRDIAGLVRKLLDEASLKSS
jgi:two-component system, cell cycle sensor histidine kinase and response regulator CckA